MGNGPSPASRSIGFLQTRAYRILAAWVILVCLASCVSPPPEKPFREREAVSLSERGMEAYANGCLDKAETHFRASLELHRSMDDQEGAARDLNDLAVLSADRSRMEEALALLSEAEAINRRRNSDSALLTNLLNRCEFCIRTDDLECAAGALDEAETRVQELKDRRAEVDALGGFLLLSRDDPEGAEKRFTAALKRVQSGENASVAAAAHLGLAKVRRDADRIPEALEQAESALVLDKEAGCWRCVGDDLVLLADLTEEAGGREHALEYLERAFYVYYYLGREASVRDLANRLEGSPAGRRIETYMHRGEREGFNAYCP